MNDNARSEEIVTFWKVAGPAKWFEKNDEFDSEISRRFSQVVDLASAGKLDDWLAEANSSLALILVLDQFPRNIYRDSPLAFDNDTKALACARTAIDRKHDAGFELPMRRFFYLPFMHSEKLEDQLTCLRLCEEANDNEGVKFSNLHIDVIRRFGRFPHRNAVLNRESSTEEIAFLNDGGFSG